MPTSIVLRDVEVAGRIVAVRIEHGHVIAVDDARRAPSGDLVIDGQGGALLRGLHDHHIHVHALAAAMASVPVGPPAVATPDAFARALRDAATHGAVRAVGYHERVAGDLDRGTLDAIVADVPVRVQHRSGGLWVLNTAALRVLGVVDDHPDGRLWRADHLVRGLGPDIDIDAVGRALARVGVTALTDATATNDSTTVARLAALPQRVRAMGPLALSDIETTLVELGEVKILLDDDRLPDFDETVALVDAAHSRGRGVAVHCVTALQLQFALAALRATGPSRDRIEHASVAPPDAIHAMRELGLTVAVQPGFVSERGDDYLRDVDAHDLDALYPVASLLAAGVPTLGSTDAPYTAFDPWRAMRAAVDRRTPSGAVLSPTECTSAEAALDLFGAGTPVRVGQRADLVLLAVPRAAMLARFDAADVAVTIIDGEIAYDGR